MPQSYWSKLVSVEPNIGKTKQGKPVREVKTESGKVLSLMGTYQQLQQLAPGADVEHSKPSEFNGRVYATVETLDPPMIKPSSVPPFTERPFVPPTKGLDQRAKEMNPPLGNGHQAPGVPTWDECRAMLNAAKDAAWALEPDVGCDPKTNDQYVSCAQARAAIINTIMIAFTNGKVQAPKEGEPEIPGYDAPHPAETEDGFPWERAS
jgi:hypothetical protein